jgi:hypothetical protein
MTRCGPCPTERHDGRCRYRCAVAQTEWLVQIVVRVTATELDAITERLGEAVCVPFDHDGPCSTPWTLTTCPVDDLDDLDEPERSGKRALLEG